MPDAEPHLDTGTAEGCIWSWCRVSLAPIGRGWTTIAIPGTGSCILKLRITCDGNDLACPERKPPLRPPGKG